MKLELKMTTEEVQNRYGCGIGKEPKMIFCKDCPCYEPNKCLLAMRFGVADGLWICAKRIQEQTKTVTDICSKCIKKMGWSL